MTKALTVSGNSATGTVPLDGTFVPAMLILANPSSSLDGQRFVVSATVVAGPPPVVVDVSAKRSGTALVRLKFTTSAGGRFGVTIGKQRTTLIANAGANSGEVFVPRSVRGRVKVTITPFDARGRRGRPVSTKVSL